LNNIGGFSNAFSSIKPVSLLSKFANIDISERKDSLDDLLSKVKESLN